MSMFRSMKFWLIVSLAVNLLFFGAVIGKAVGADGRPKSAPPVNEIGAFLRALPDEDRRQLGDQLRNTIDAKRQSGAALDLEAVAVIVETEPFDPIALSNELAAVRESTNEIAENAHGSIVEVISTLDADERQEFAIRLRELPKRPERGGRDRDRDGKRR